MNSDWKDPGRFGPWPEFVLLGVVGATFGVLLSGRLDEARNAARHANTVADLRMQVRAIECYAVDHADYPRMSWGNLQGNNMPFNDQYNGNLIFGTLTREVTTPIAYLETFVDDPVLTAINTFASPYTYQAPDTHQFVFQRVGSVPIPGSPGYVYRPANLSVIARMRDLFGQYYVWGVGPASTPSAANWYIQYDPTNGASSAGNVYLSQNFAQPVQVEVTGL